MVCRLPISHDTIATQMKNLAVVLAVALLLLFLFFEVRFDFQVSMPREIVELDSEQENRYIRCVEERDAEIHRIAFATIDNPDVQREYLATQKDEAKLVCRSEFPMKKNTKKQSFRVKLVDLK
jgi:hypothetical protein